MPETLAGYLKRRAERSFRVLSEQIEDLSPEEAQRDAHPRWPGQPWGIGQNGSIAGIIFHVAAWKRLTLPLLQPGGRARTAEEFDADAAPAPNDWPGIAAWFKQAGTAWNAELARLPDAAFEEVVEWEGETLPRWKYVIEMMEHDIQHLAQIEYLRQKHLAERSET